MKSYWIRVGLIGRPYRVVSLKEKETHRDPHREEGHVKMRAEIGKMHLQAKDSWEPLETKTRQGSLLP